MGKVLSFVDLKDSKVNSMDSSIVFFFKKQTRCFSLLSMAHTHTKSQRKKVDVEQILLGHGGTRGFERV